MDTHLAEVPVVSQCLSKLWRLVASNSKSFADRKPWIRCLTAAEDAMKYHSTNAAVHTRAMQLLHLLACLEDNGNTPLLRVSLDKATSAMTKHGEAPLLAEYAMSLVSRLSVIPEMLSDILPFADGIFRGMLQTLTDNPVRVGIVCRH